ncbi:MAG: asparagine synthetase B family protein [Planctomycetota bacterium]
MVDRLRHRGPDARGVHRADGVSLGHARLSILDLSPTGAQPMLDESGRLAMVYNGEIYNFQEIRESLSQAGHQFAGTSDTEVLLRGYAEWGEDVFSRLNGMWAVAILDLARNVLLLCRDRLGVKPLFYSVAERGLAFASELPSLLEAIPNRRIDPEAVDMLLSSQFIPSPMSIIDGVRKLQPRELLSMDLKTGNIRRGRSSDSR